MPSIHRAVEVTLPEAEALADLYGIMFDLEAATYLCAKAIELSLPPQHDYLIVEGLVAAAIIRYCRCFPSKARLGLRREDLAELNDKDFQAHDYFKNLRDKFVAHSVNPFEETYVNATASVLDGIKHPIQSVAPGQHRLMLSPSTANALVDLITKVREIVKKSVSIEEKKLLGIIQSLPLDTIHSGDLHTPRHLKPSDVSKTRKPRSNKALRGRHRHSGKN